MTKKLSILILIALLAFTGCGRKKAAAPPTPAIPVKVTTVSQGSLAEIFKTTGVLEANKEVSVSAKIAGRVNSVNFELGDYVSKGQTLVTLEKEDLSNQYNQAKAQLKQAQASYQQSKNTYTRMNRLFAEQAISQQEFDATHTQLQIAENQLRQAEIAVELSSSQLNNTDIKAPISGYVSLRNVNQGEVINPGAPLITIVDIAKVFVTINLSDSYIGQIKHGQTAQINFANTPGKNFIGTVQQIAPATDPASKTFPVRIMLNNQSGNFKAGMLAEVKFNFNQRNNVLQIPVEAVIDETGTKSVFTVAKNKAVRQQVSLGVSNGKMIEIISGLTQNQTVVTLGQNNLEEGMKVVVK